MLRHEYVEKMNIAPSDEEQIQLYNVEVLMIIQQELIEKAVIIVLKVKKINSHNFRTNCSKIQFFKNSLLKIEFSPPFI